MYIVMTGRAVDDLGIFHDRGALNNRLMRSEAYPQDKIGRQVDVLFASDDAIERRTTKVREARSQGIEVASYSRMFRALALAEREGTTFRAAFLRTIPPRTRPADPVPTVPAAGLGSALRVASPGPNLQQVARSPTGRLGAPEPAFQQPRPARRLQTEVPWSPWSTRMAWPDLSDSDIEFVETWRTRCGLIIEYRAMDVMRYKVSHAEYDMLASDLDARGLLNCLRGWAVAWEETHKPKTFAPSAPKRKLRLD